MSSEILEYEAVTLHCSSGDLAEVASAVLQILNYGT